MSGSHEEISLYFHIPFCKRKCDYCHFYVIPEKEEGKDLLLNAFLMEWQSYLPLLQNKTVVSIYFGGGTPSLFGAKRVYKLLNMIMSSLKTTDNVEITLEANPDNLSFELLKEYRDAGINRLSIGIQSFDDGLLHLLGRLHNAQVAENSIIQAVAAGFSRISIDLMYDLPQQTLEHWKNTIDVARSLPISHLSLYNLTIEPHTLFFKKRHELTPTLPNPEMSLAMYEMALERFEESGLKPYEISAFARNNDFSIHNLGYWTARPFIGFGPSAFSYWEGRRFRNIANLKHYSEALHNNKSAVDFEEQLSPAAKIRELLTVRIRLREGVDTIAFQDNHGPFDQETLLTIQKLELEGFLKREERTLFLTKRGILFYDEVASELI
jgi:oxygen-independent coproporphyrinogen III oxidase